MAVAGWIGVLFLVGVLFGVGMGVRDVRKRHRGQLLHPIVVLKGVGMLFVLVGFSGFVGRMLLTSGWSAKVPGYVEFPVEPDAISFTDSKGNIFVPLAEIGRMQVYSPDRAFRCGWSFQTFGGNARVDLIDDSTVSVFTVKRRSLADYDIRGNLRSMEFGASLGSLQDYRNHVDFPPKITSPYLLLSCTSLVGAWVTGLGGLLLLLGIEKFEHRKIRRIRISSEIPPRLAQTIHP
jgi:hypothetical protein